MTNTQDNLDAFVKLIECQTPELLEIVTYPLSDTARTTIKSMRPSKVRDNGDGTFTHTFDGRGNA